MPVWTAFAQNVSVFVKPQHGPWAEFASQPTIIGLSKGQPGLLIPRAPQYYFSFFFFFFFWGGGGGGDSDKPTHFHKGKWSLGIYMYNYVTLVKC